MPCTLGGNTLATAGQACIFKNYKKCRTEPRIQYCGRNEATDYIQEYIDKKKEEKNDV